MLAELVDTIIIGAGHAGLSISYYLKGLGRDHIVFEKDHIGNSWTSQRWDSFRFNTPNRYNTLPGFENMFDDVNGFCSSGDFAAALGKYAGINNLPVANHCEVISLKLSGRSSGFDVCVSRNDSIKLYRSRNVVVASGGQNRRYIPPFSKRIPENILQMHACDYRNPSVLPDGSVVVIGGAQSGIQITEELLDNGRKVFLSTSKVPRVPRRYRGKDIVEWLSLTGFFNVPFTDPSLLMSRMPQISGAGPGGHTVSLQSLARKGAILTGSAVDADSGKIWFNTDVLNNIRFADESSKRIKETIDEFLSGSGYDLPDNENDPDDLPYEPESFTALDSLGLADNNVSVIIWTCGFTGEFSYIRIPVFDNSGRIRHHDGISDVKGLYFIGLPWLRKRKSGIVMGIRDDAEFITGNLINKIPLELVTH